MHGLWAYKNRGWRNVFHPLFYGVWDMSPTSVFIDSNFMCVTKRYYISILRLDQNKKMEVGVEAKTIENNEIGLDN